VKGEEGIKKGKKGAKPTLRIKLARPDRKM
jgi:hypothetical protein